MPDDLVYRVRCETAGWGGAPGLNTFYFAQDLETEPSEDLAAADVVTRVQAFWVSIKNCFPSIWDLQVGPVVDVINTDNGDLDSSFVTDEPVMLHGIDGAAFGPQAAMVCADLVTTAIIDSHRVHGRAFLGPLAQVNDADGTPSAGVLDSIQAGLTALSIAEPPSPPLVVWSRRKGASLKHPTGLGGSSHLVSAITVKDTFAILRSRRQ